MADDLPGYLLLDLAAFLNLNFRQFSQSILQRHSGQPVEGLRPPGPEGFRDYGAAACYFLPALVWPGLSDVLQH